MVIDVDLQDPPELIESMYSKLKEGYEVVYAKRRSREGESIIMGLFILVILALRVRQTLSSSDVDPSFWRLFR